MTTMRRLLSFLFPLLLVASLRAQSVHWDPDGGTLAGGQIMQLSLVFEQCEPKGDVQLPKTPGLEFGQPSQSQSSRFQITFGGGSTNKVNQSTVTLAYPARAASGQTTVQIPAFDVDTDQGRKHVAAVTYQVGRATVGNNRQNSATSPPLDAVAQSHFSTPGAVWAGEVFQLGYTLDIQESYAVRLQSVPQWEPAPLVVEDDWSSNNPPSPNKSIRNGEEWVSIPYHTRAYAKAAGEVPLAPVTQTVALQTGVQNLGFFTQPVVGVYNVTSTPATLTVKPLPSPAPPEFAGAVGSFTFDSKVVPDTVAVGEPVTWTLTLDGTGNWPDISALPKRSVSRDFRVVAPSAKRNTKEKVMFDASLTEDVVLIPTKPGIYHLGPVKLACFDPKTGDYKNLTTPDYTLTVTEPAVAAAAPTAAGIGPVAVNPGGTGPQIPNPPAGIPRDPLSPAPPTGRPLALRPFLLLLLAPFALLPVLWLSLAARQAWLTDPRRPRRDARRRLGATLTALRAGPPPDLAAQLLPRWQHDTAALFGVELAAPSSTALFDHDGTTPPTGDGTSDWTVLWQEADRALYGDHKALPRDWLARAEAAFEAKRVRGFQPLQLFLPRNLFPKAAKAGMIKAESLKAGGLNPAAGTAATVTVLLLLLSAFSFPPSAFAASPAAAAASYRAADFPAAEKSWRAALATASTDWTAHHNLALALAQQGRWGESAGHALAAFVQQPHDPATFWHLDLALKNAGFTPDPVLPFLVADPGARLAILASPAQWQCFAGLAAVLLAAVPALLLWRAYGARGRWLQPVAWVALTGGLLLGGAAALSLHLYGPLADARTVVVWRAGLLRSIPTEADTTQKTTPLAAGLVAVADKSFLDGRWVRLAFANGQTGWVRREDVVGLW
jgi:hypothetical protein